MRADGQIQINAPPERVWGMVADVTRMGEWSPECYRCEWLGSATGPGVGARFRGANKWRFGKWVRTSEITVAEPGRELAFITLPTFPYPDSTLWRYRLEPSNGGTLVAESYEVLRTNWVMRTFGRVSGRYDEMEGAMRRTLERLKAAAEQVARSRSAV